MNVPTRDAAVSAHDVVVLTESPGLYPLVARGVLVDGKPLCVPSGSRVTVEIGDDELATVHVRVFARSIRFEGIGEAASNEPGAAPSSGETESLVRVSLDRVETRAKLQDFALKVKNRAQKTQHQVVDDVLDRASGRMDRVVQIPRDAEILRDHAAAEDVVRFPHDAPPSVDADPTVGNARGTAAPTGDTTEATP